MAGKKRSNNAARKAQFIKRAGSTKVNKKGRGGPITVKLKEARAIRHELLVEKEAAKKAETAKVYETVCSKYNLDSKGKYALKRLIGTVNISRLQAVLDNNLASQSWFTARYETLMPVSATTGERVDSNAAVLIKSTKLGVFI